MKPVVYKTNTSSMIKNLVKLNEIRLKKAYGMFYEVAKTRAWRHPGSTTRPTSQED